MKRHKHAPFIFFILAWLISYLPAPAQNDLPPPTADVQTIPAGSWIIPMDNTYQGTSGIFNLKTYGLLNQLLWNNVHLKWAIKTGKGKDSVDFKANALQMLPTKVTSTMIAGANFETTTLSPNWTYTNSGGATSTTANKYNGGRSWRMDANRSITMSNISLTDYSNVVLSVAFASSGGPDATEDLYLDISYDNGATWNGTGSVRLVAGDGTSVHINNTRSNTVSPNPYLVNIPSSASQVRVRLRTSSTGSWSSEYYYIDDVILTGDYNRSFVSGPFIIAPADTAAARTVINNYNSPLAAAEKVNVYYAYNSFSADIRYTVSHKPKIVIYDDGGNADIHEDILLAAGFTSTYYSIIGSGTVIDSINCYTIASTPHWDAGTYSSSDSARLLNLKSFLRSGGNFLAQCHGITTVENFAPARYISTAGIHDINAGVTTVQYKNTDLPVMQFHGAFTPDGGSVHNWNKPSGSWVWPRYVPLYFISSGDTANIINVTKISNSTSSIGGNMIYLGGHNYYGSTLADINGMRIYLNAVMMPAKDLQVDVTATSNSPVCPGDTIKLYGNIYGGFDFSWTGPNSFSSTQQNPVITNATSAKAGTYTLTMTVPPGGGGCAYTYNSTAVVVNKPIISVQSTAMTICRDDSVTLSLNSNSGLSTANWYINTGVSCLPNGTYLGAGYTMKVAPKNTTKYTAIGITSSGGCRDTATNCFTVTVDTLPVITSTTSTSIGSCYSKGVSATITAGSGGSGCTETYQWRQDGGSWQSYTSGTTVGTTARDSIEIRATRNCTSGCNNQVVRSRWIVAPEINMNSNYTLTNCGNAIGYIAQLSATNPSPNTGLWTKVSGPGSVLTPTAYNASITGITPGATAVVKWVVTNSIGCKDSSSNSITAPVVDTTLVSRYSNFYCLTCPIQNGNTYTYYDANGKILMKVTDPGDGNTLGSTEVCADLEYANPGTNNPVPADVPVLASNSNQPVLPRSWSVNPGDNNAAYQATMYFTDEELNAIMGRASGTIWSFADVYQLHVTSYPNVSTNYTAFGGPNGAYQSPSFSRVGNYWAVSVSGTGDRTFFLHPVTYPWATLPVELVNLHAVGQENYIRVDWATASELNNDRFEVERSTDGKSFSYIGMVRGGGTVHEPRKYLFDDKNAETNTVYYYRLRQVDHNQAYKFSDMVSASIQKPGSFKITELRPNPATEFTFLHVSSAESTSLTVIILSMDGRVQSEKTYELNNGITQIELNLGQLSAGTYLCRLENGQGFDIKKIIKAR
jgi:Secretion system C-terminal sorting domain